MKNEYNSIIQWAQQNSTEEGDSILEALEDRTTYTVQDRKDIYSTWRTVLEGIRGEGIAIRASEDHYQQQIFTDGTCYPSDYTLCKCEPCTEGYRAGLDSPGWKGYEVRYIPVTN